LLDRFSMISRMFLCDIFIKFEYDQIIGYFLPFFIN
jgi:hypothetical protein